MLQKSDTETVRAWLANAFAEGAKHGMTPAGLASLCGVTAQAVNGWKKTGRITKKNLEMATRYFGHGPSFLSSAVVARENAAGSAWPFRTVRLNEISSLKPQQLQRLEKLIRDRLDEWREDAGDRQVKKRAA